MPHSQDATRFEIKEIGVNVHQLIDGSSTGKYPDGFIISPEKAKANAAFIVLACNSHDSLSAFERHANDIHDALTAERDRLRESNAELIDVAKFAIECASSLPGKSNHPLAVQARAAIAKHGGTANGEHIPTAEELETFDRRDREGGVNN